MGIDGHPAAVIAHRNRIVRMQFDLNPIGVACNSLVHGVVEDFRDHVVQRPFVRAANIHARTFADRFEPFEDFNRRCVVIGRLCAG